MWQLDADGTLTSGASPDTNIVIDAAEPLEGVPDARAAAVLFGGTADGRGFSVARQLRARGYDGRLIATGPLIPDQARHCFQSGFDAIAISDDRIDRHGEGAWRDAINHSVRDLYVADRTSRGAERGIWALRQQS
ncbi:DUF934 domain-containing protein [Acuticoccus sp. MNP-M23]|uniref:DUF934 domain-containing protein n=1 Tax=Acuticoccus sp. MNP-M23 TaxID=3072793 RepID=UPI002816287F|nr:DUF934 domain-containing protein [Acuticoccus sp. MNP-M23]WMS43995.1 DUF934 domain-containing protein [Acuticoccus sp. MNP-M23]